MYQLVFVREEIPMSTITPEKLQTIIEAAIMVAGRPLTLAAMLQLFPDDEKPSNAEIKEALAAITGKYADTSIELKEVASGYRFQAKSELSPWLSRLWEERSPRYSRAFLETLAIVAYKQPVTRAEIEEIRGVTVSSHIVKTLQEREWIRVVGYREVPGKPAIYATTKDFLDYFNIKSLSELPTLAEFKDMEAQEQQLQVQLAMENSNVGPADSEVIPEEREAIINEEIKDNVIPIHDNFEIVEESELEDQEKNIEEDEEELATG
jgi:segregation and condensation protein B